MRELFLHKNCKSSKFYKALTMSVITEVERKRRIGEVLEELRMMRDGEPWGMTGGRQCLHKLGIQTLVLEQLWFCIPALFLTTYVN